VIKFVDPCLVDFHEVKDEIETSFDTKWLTNGIYVGALEKKFAKKFLMCESHVVCVSSATTGLMLSARLLLNRYIESIKTQKDKEVEMPNVALSAISFMATVSSVLWNGGWCNFVDVDYKTWNICESEYCMGDVKFDWAVRTHLFGNPCKANRTGEMLEIPTIYDCAHALGSYYLDNSLFKKGDFHVFSLGMQKLLPCGEGGIVVCKEKEDAVKIKRMLNYGNDNAWDSPIVGMNGKMQELNAIIGLRLLDDLDTIIGKRRIMSIAYDEMAREFGFVPQRTNGSGVCLTYFVVRVIEKKFGMSADVLRGRLMEIGIDTRRMYPVPANKLKMLNGKGQKCPIAEALSDEFLAFPFDVTVEEGREIHDAIRRIKR